MSRQAAGQHEREFWFNKKTRIHSGINGNGSFELDYSGGTPLAWRGEFSLRSTPQSKEVLFHNSRVMPDYFSETDFEQLSWHDNTLYGWSVLLGDITQGDWRSDLVFDIDYIVEWVCGPDQRCRFRVAPATLVFHHVTDLNLAINWGDSGHQTALYEVSIAQIERSLIPNQKICLDRPYYRWAIQTNAPKDGTIVFGASGFTQTLRSEPLLLDEQKLSPAQRSPLFLPPS